MWYLGNVRARLAGKRFYYGWVVVVACFLATGVVFGMTYAFGVFLDPMASTLGTSAASTSLLFGVQLFVLYTSAGPVGGLVEWLAPRRALVLAAVLLSGGLVAASQVSSLLLLLLFYSIMVGIGMSIAFVVGYATPLRWFAQRRGMATALSSAGLGVGMVVISPLASILVTHLGWRGALPLLGIALALTLLLSALLMVDDPSHVDASVDAEFPHGRPDSGTNWRHQVRFIREVSRNRTFLVFFAGYTLMYATLFVLLNHIVNYAAMNGIRETGVLALSVIGGTTALTRLAVGGVADRLGRVGVFVVCGTVMALTLIVLPLARTSLVLFTLAVIFGVGYGGTGALLSSVPADLFGGHNPTLLFGFVSISFAIPGLLAPFAAALGFEQLGSYAPVFFTTGVVGLIGISLVSAAAWFQGELGDGL